MIRLSYIGLFFVLCNFLFAQNENQNVTTPKREVRAVWIATVNSLDWPPSFDPIEQQNSLKEIVARLKAANFNTIFFQVRSRADAMYNSRFEPWAQQLTGTLGGKPAWDPLSFIIDEAHANGLEVHAWFNTFVAWTKKEMPPHTVPEHIVNKYPELVKPVNGEWWFDPGIPSARDYIVQVALDLVRNYELDGIQFDFIRYPNKPIADDETFRRYNNGMKKDDWRRDNINKFVQAFHDSVIKFKPMLKIGAAPTGIYKNTNGIKGQQSYYEIFQDSRRWLKEGWMDYLAPQVYWTLGVTRGDPDYAMVAMDWANNKYGKHVYVGIGAYKSDVFNEIPILIDTTRALGLEGNSFFRFENISKELNVGNRYRNIAILPSMPWKDSIPPNPPKNVQVNNIVDGIFKIQWSQPEIAIDLDGAKRFCIYRSTVKDIDAENPENLLAIVPGTILEFTDTIKHISSAKYFYAVSVLDKGNNESKPAVESIVIPEIVEISKRFSFNFMLGQSYPNPASSFVFIPYEIKEQTPVFLKILDSQNRELINVVDAVQEPGRYVACADVSKLEDGFYTYLLVAGNFSERKIFKVDD